jgi:hypothetical protein
METPKKNRLSKYWCSVPHCLSYNKNISRQIVFRPVKNFLFSSAKPRDFDGMLGTGLPVSMYTTKTPIDKCHFNVTQLKDFFYIFCKRQISIKLLYLYQRRIPYNLIFTTKCNDSSILITTISCDYLNLSLAEENNRIGFIYGNIIIRQK